MTALDVLTRELQGEFISRFSVGDTWDLFIGDYCLTAHEILSEDEEQLSNWYQNNYPAFNSCVDKENVSKSTIVSAHLRKEITGVSIEQSGRLTIHFEHDTALVIPTNVEIVDWQWCLNKTGRSPYSEYLVACFWEGEVKVNHLVLGQK